ncbi:hypothetical protein D7X87_01580 [bacterium D16-54]|nr:hypothetical protein D7X87_01580 [bacterium D16-54]RKJ16979.1 hypothetical protein D7X65_01580 [bacterium D16-56]
MVFLWRVGNGTDDVVCLPMVSGPWERIGNRLRGCREYTKEEICGILFLQKHGKEETGIG